MKINRQWRLGGLDDRRHKKTFLESNKDQGRGPASTSLGLGWPRFDARAPHQALAKIRSARAQSGIAATLLLGRRLRQPKKVGITAAYLSGFAPTPGRRERNFWMRRQGTQNRRRDA